MVGKLFAKVFLRIRNDLPLHKFYRRRGGLRTDNQRNGADCLSKRRERNEQADRFLRQGQQAQHRFCHNAERALRADDQIHEIVARAVFDNLAAQLHDHPVGQYNLQRAHIIACDAVFDGAQTAGVRADVPADRG